MARAKRTDRAEARRRYRASLAESDPDANLDEDETGAAPAGAAPAGAAAATATAKKGSTRTAAAPEPARPGLAYAFRSAFRPLDLRGDLRALPMLLRHPAFLFPVVLSGLSVALIPLVGLNALTSTFYQYFSFTAPLGTAFIAGFFAPRASWLVGGLAALASVGFQAIAFSTGSFGGFLDVFSDPATGGTLARDAAARLILSQALFVGVPSGAFFASAAAWYRRFLKSASPNRARQAQSSGSGRRPDGKVPKKQESRPLLARKR